MALMDNATSHKRRNDRAAGRSDGSQGLPEKLGFLSVPEARTSRQTGIFQSAQLDKSALEPSPIEPDWILEGNPEAMCKNLSRIGNYWTTVDHWSCTAGKFRWRYFCDETILILEGEAFITDDNGVEYHAVPGNTLTFPDGSAANWHVPDYVRKIAFNQKSVPGYLHKVCKAVNKVHRKLFK